MSVFPARSAESSLSNNAPASLPSSAPQSSRLFALEVSLLEVTHLEDTLLEDTLLEETPGQDTGLTDGGDGRGGRQTLLVPQGTVEELAAVEGPLEDMARVTTLEGQVEAVDKFPDNNAGQ